MVENKYYERKIRYLDLMENGERTSGAGFVKTEIRGMDINLALTVKGLHPTDTYEREVKLLAGNGEFAIGQISLKEGEGQFLYHAVMDYSQLQGVRIVLGGTREISCRWQEDKRGNGSAGTHAAPQTEMQAGKGEDGERHGDVMRGAKAQQETAYDETVQEAPGRKRTAPGKAMDGTDDVKRQGDGGFPEIPWDEVQAAEKSLERAEEILSGKADKAAGKTAVREADRATERMPGKTAARQTDREADRATERMSGKTAARQTDREADRATERMSGKTAARQTDRATERMSGKTAARQTDREADRATERVPGKTAVTDAAGWGTEDAAVKRVSGRRLPSGGYAEHERRPVRLMEDKWQQIWAIYPHVRPFQDEREYLSIGPADFVLLSGEAYRAANNSFLLHGYYNYEHLILTKIEKRGEVSYYIGVPGNYYEREKQVAVMFGFESFECGTEPAQAGDFGYYMMRTQI